MPDRRRFMQSSVALGLCPLPAIAGTRSEIRLLRGPVFVDNVAANESTRIGSRAMIAVGHGGEIEFTLGGDAFRLGGRTLLECEAAEAGTPMRLRLVSGNMLATFAERRENEVVLELPIAAMRLRGGGLFAQAGGLQVYTCLCYGSAELSAGPANESLIAQHHRAVSITRNNKDYRIAAGGAGLGHDDRSLARLAAHVERELPVTFAPRSASE